MGSRDFRDFAHYRMDHEVGGVGFYHVGGWGCADDVGLGKALDEGPRRKS